MLQQRVIKIIYDAGVRLNDFSVEDNTETMTAAGGGEVDVDDTEVN